MFFPQTLQANVRQCLAIDDTFSLQDYDLLVIYLPLPTSFKALYIPLLTETADAPQPD